MPQNENPKQELSKLGSGHAIDLAKMYEEMDEDHLDKMLKVTLETAPKEEVKQKPGPFTP